MLNGVIEHILFPETNQRRHGQLIIRQCLRGEVVCGMAQFQAEIADQVFDLRRFHTGFGIEFLYRRFRQQHFINKQFHCRRQFRITQEVVAVVTVFIMLIQIDIIDAGTAVNDGVVNNKAFEMQNTQRFAGIHRHPEDRDKQIRVRCGNGMIPVGVGGIRFCADTPALCAVPVNKDFNIQFRISLFGGI